MNPMIQDLRYAARTLARTPSFTALAVMVLALGIGANSTIFSIVSAVIIRPLPFPDAGRLVELFLPSPGGASRGPVSVIDFEDWREQNHVFDDIALVNTLSRGLTLTGDAEPEQLTTAYVHPAFFTTLGVQPEFGRSLRPDENDPGSNHVVVISHGLWRRRFGGVAAIAGRPVTLDGQPFTISGVMPDWFRFPGAEIDVWAPESLIDASRAPRRRDVRYQRVVARLAKDVTLEQARAEMNTIAARLMAQYPDTNAGRATVAIVPLQEAIVDHSVRSALYVLFGAVIFVLLMACANVSNLLMARTETRQRELAIRLALGASRLRVVWQLLAESLLIALAGGALGLVVGAWGLDGLVRLSRDFLPAQNEIAVDRRVLGFTLVTAVLAAVVSGCWPAIKFSRPDLQVSLSAGGRGLSGGVVRRAIRTTLVVAEIALAFVLVVGATLMLRSFHRLLGVHPGFNPNAVLTVTMNASSTRYPDQAAYVSYYRQVLARARQVHGVQTVGATRNLPLRGTPENWPVTITGQAPVAAGTEPLVPVHQISPDYFRTMDIPLLLGRTFGDQDDEDAPRVAIVSQAMSRRFWPAGDPMDRTFRYGQQLVTIVGVVADVRQRSLTTEGQETFYVPQAQDPRRGFTVVMRVSGDPRAFAPTVRREILTVDPEHPIIRIATMEDVLSESVAQPRLMTALLGSFGGLAIVLALLGIYGLITYMVSRRSCEFGVRIALGATPRDVLAIVLREGAWMSLTGVTIGTAAALGLTRFLSSQLYEVSAVDTMTFATVAGILLVTSMVGSYVPARRATRVDPMLALRSE